MRSIFKQRGHERFSVGVLRQLRASAPTLLLVYGAGVAILVLFRLVGEITGRPFNEFIRDPTSAGRPGDYLTGSLANLGVLLWWTGAVAAALAGYARRSDPRALPLLAAGVFTGWLALDDLYLLHETFFPRRGVPEHYVVMAYPPLAAAYAWVFRDFLRQSDWILIASAVGVPRRLDLHRQHEQRGLAGGQCEVPRHPGLDGIPRSRRTVRAQRPAYRPRGEVTGLGDVRGLSRMTSPQTAEAFFARTVVLVEGISDQVALEALAECRGRNLAAESISVVPIGGAQAIGSFLKRFGPQGLDVRLAGLCDAGEEGDFRRGLERAGLGSHLTRAEMERLGFYVCVADLEDELIRALGAASVEQVVDAQGELGSFRTLQKQPAQQGLAIEAQLRRFMGTRGGRKIHYARLLVDALDLTQVPRPLDRVLAHV